MYVAAHEEQLTPANPVAHTHDPLESSVPPPEHEAGGATQRGPMNPDAHAVHLGGLNPVAHAHDPLASATPFP